MKTLATVFFVVFTSLLAFSQSDYRIEADRKVKVGYKPFPQDFRTKDLMWAAVHSTCLKSEKYGNWFELVPKGKKLKFSVHTGGKMGDLKNPRMYLGRVVEKGGNRALEEVACIVHNGGDGVFSIEALNVDKNSQYFLLLAADVAGAGYAIELTDDFTPKLAEDKKSALPQIVHRIFGRVSNADGKAQPGVKVSLLDNQNLILSTTVSNALGMFTFEKLPPNEVYMTRIESDDTALKIDLFLLDENGDIKSRASRIGDQLYAFGTDVDGFKNLNLLTATDYELDVDIGKTGIAGRVVDSETYLFGQASVKVGLYADNRKLLESSVTDSDGRFSFKNLEGESYAVQVECDVEEDFAEVVFVDDLNVPFSFSNSKMMDANGFFTFEPLPKEEIELKRMELRDTKIQMPSDFGTMEAGSSIVLRNILFASGSADLLPESNAELDRLVTELKNMESVKIEISGHTDNLGSPETNRILSESRAKAVVEYLSTKGIDKARLKYVGVGDKKPIASNETEEGRKQNRRVEFVVLD